MQKSKFLVIVIFTPTTKDSSVKSKKTVLLCKVVQDELNSNGYLKPNQVVVILDGSLHLTGKVRTYFHRQMAIAVVKNIGIEIRDEILVQNSPALQS